jgi:hypothetical protein
VPPSPSGCAPQEIEPKPCNDRLYVAQLETFMETGG